MSGICGLFNLDDAPATDVVLQSMTAMLERRGPERTGRWHDGPVGLGHTLLATTPELIFEHQPFRHAATGCVITADVRLDNRAELASTLDVSSRMDSTGDAELILLAYLKWDDQCGDRLLGDFAFAIWDPRHQKLFCARDHFGMRPIYYHHQPHQRFVFASDPRAILVLPQVPYRINEGRIADFLVPQLEWIDYTSTFYESVYRLPPGHNLTVTAGHLVLVEYWKPAPGPELGKLSDDEYAEGFLDVFTKAVDARLRTPPGCVGSMLSGGIDSGSVVVVAKELLDARGDGPLHTFSACRRHIGDETECPESHAIRDATSMTAITPALIHPDSPENVEPTISKYEEPFDGEFTILKAIYSVARSKGMRVLLDGAGGDVVLSEGSYIVRLIRQGHIRHALTEIAAEKRFWDEKSVFPGLYRYSRAALVPDFIKNLLRPVRQRHRINDYLDKSLISREFAERVDIARRFERMQQIFPQLPTRDYATECCGIIRSNMTGGRERYGRIAAATGIEARDPFLDKRVVDFSAHMPGHLRLKHGMPKIVLRELMTCKLPASVVWAKRKPHLGWLFNEVATKAAENRGEPIFDRICYLLADYVDTAALAQAWAAYCDGSDTTKIHSAHVLTMWLREVEKRPVVPNS